MAYASTESGTYKNRNKAANGDARAPKFETTLTQLIEWGASTNVAEDIDGEKLRLIGCRVVREYNIDEQSRSEWKEKAKKALERSKLKAEKKSYPFDGAANVKYPLLTIASLQFAARAYSAIVDGQRIVKGQVIGDDPEGVKRSKADRVSRHMSWQLMNEMPEWEEDTDTMLHQLPIVGCCFRKTYYDPTMGRNRSEMVSAIDLCVHQKTRSMETVPRITQTFTLYPHEIEERIADGVFCDVDVGTPAEAGEDEDAPHEFLEQHRYLDLDDDGKREPWIVTVHKETEQVVRIVANYDPAQLQIKHEDGEKPKLGRLARYNVFTKYPFFRDPEGGFYDLGFGELLNSISEIVDSTINQMMDAGHLQNAGGGFIGSGLRLKKGQLRFSPGQYHTVDAPGIKIREAIYNMEHPGPSPVLFQLLGMMVEAGNKMASISEIITGDMPRSQPATTTLAMIEQGMKLYTSIYKRIYRALKREYGLLFALNARHLPEESYFTVLDNRKAIKREDYQTGAEDIVPVADPTIVTDAQKMMRGQAILDAAMNPAAEGVVNKRAALIRHFETIGVEDPEELLMPEPEGPSPMEQLAERGMAAKVAGDDAKAKKTEAEVENVKVDTELKAREAAAMKESEAQEFGMEFEKKLRGLDKDEANGRAEPS